MAHRDDCPGAVLDDRIHDANVPLMDVVEGGLDAVRARPEQKVLPVAVVSQPLEIKFQMNKTFARK